MGPDVANETVVVRCAESARTLVFKCAFCAPLSLRYGLRGFRLLARHLPTFSVLTSRVAKTRCFETAPFVTGLVGSAS
jgi:hypothetical protein